MLLTSARIQSASRICRFNGWTTRPYSILEHSIIGTRVLAEIGATPDLQKAFLLHDLEETEFSDMITPHKRKYMNAQYFADVEEWERDLCAEVRLPYSTLTDPDVKFIDGLMADVESHTISMCEWRGDLQPIPATDVAFRLILSREHAGHGQQDQWWNLYDNL